jgi:serine/threonine-protein kinase
MAMEKDGSLLIANLGTNQILRRQPDGHLTVLAGDGKKGFSGDGGPAVDAELNRPNGIAVASDGTVYVADTGNNRVRAISPDGIITTVAGDGTDDGGTEAQGPATRTGVFAPVAVAIGPDGDLYIADTGIQMVSPDGLLTTVHPGGVGALTVGGAPQFFDPSALAFDSAGNLYVSNESPKEIFEIEPDGATTELPAYVTAGGLVTAPDGSVIAGDYGNFAIDRLVAGRLTPVASFSLNSIPGLAGVFRPSGVAVSSAGEIYADTDGLNGGTNTPALIAVDPDGHVRLLATGTTPSTVSNGTIEGVFEGMGNTETHDGGVPSSGDLTISAARTSYRTVARTDGAFSISLPPGTYRITGRDPGQTGGQTSCVDPDVHVLAQQITRTTVTCVFH